MIQSSLNLIHIRNHNTSNNVHHHLYKSTAEHRPFFRNEALAYTVLRLIITFVKQITSETRKKGYNLPWQSN